MALEDWEWLIHHGTKPSVSADYSSLYRTLPKADPAVGFRDGGDPAQVMPLSSSQILSSSIGSEESSIGKTVGGEGDWRWSPLWDCSFWYSPYYRPSLEKRRRYQKLHITRFTERRMATKSESIIQVRNSFNPSHEAHAANLDD
jgi:hypothetical protein